MSIPESIWDAWPDVSVVVATRDRPQLLERALESILGQSYPGSIECLVVYDQSEPVLPAVHVPENRSLRVLTNVRTPGLAGSRNTGADAASGELLAFCDDDDEWLPRKLCLQVDALERDPEALAVSTGVFVEYRKRTRTRLPSSDFATFADLLRSRRWDIHPSTMLVRRDAFLTAIGPIDERIPGSYCEDYEWLLRAARLGPLVTVQEPLARIHWHRSSWFAGRWQMIIAALGYLLAKVPELEGDPKGLARIYGQIAFAHAASGQRREGRSWARRCLKLDPKQPRAYLALLVGTGLVSGETLLHLANTRGRGI